MRKLMGGAALVGGTVAGAAITSLVILGPTLGVTPFGGSAPTDTPRAFDLPSALSARAHLPRHPAGALGAPDGAAFAKGGAPALPFAGGSATGGPTVLRGGKTTLASAPAVIRGASTGRPAPGIGNGTVQVPVPIPGGAAIGPSPTPGGTAGGVSLGGPATPPETDAGNAPPASATAPPASPTTPKDDESSVAAATDDEPAPAEDQSPAIDALIRNAERKRGRHGVVPPGLVKALARHGEGNDTAPAPDEGTPAEDSSTTDRDAGEGEARGRNDDGGDGRDRRHGRGSGEESDG
jgi:hypothetical protein